MKKRRYRSTRKARQDHVGHGAGGFAAFAAERLPELRISSAFLPCACNSPSAVEQHAELIDQERVVAVDQIAQAARADHAPAFANSAAP
jgi:hypothetical protein